jgi:glucose dehydrogenase
MHPGSTTIAGRLYFVKLIGDTYLAVFQTATGQNVLTHQI